MNFIKNSKGITLIALVITIIVLLILAGVSLSLVTGSNGILGKASSAVDKTNHAQIAEEVELAMAELKTQYYEDKYVDKTTSDTYGAYAKAELTAGVDTTNGKITLNGTEVTYTPNSAKGTEVTGTFDEATGEVKIAGATTGGAGENGTAATLFSQIDATNYGDYVDLETSYVKGKTLDISTTETEIATEDWRIFYHNANGTWLILADYLPYSYESKLGTGLVQYMPTTYNWCSTTSRKDLINRLNDSDAWNNLLGSSYTTKGITVKGAVDLPTWVASWNAKADIKLYTDTYSNKNGSKQSDDLDGYYIGTSENPTTTYQYVESDKDGYENTLYFPHKSMIKNAYGFWLASPSAYDTNGVVFVECRGYVYNDNDFYNCYDASYYGVRPVVYLPSETLASKTGDIWKVEK